MRPWMRALLGLVFAAAQAVPGRAATDLKTMQPSEIEALQKRLTDAGCYQGAIDGQASAATDAAVKACPDQAPVLRIETGMHTANIRRIGVDAACRLLATGSDDKTVRLWSMPEGRLLRTIRLPISGGNGGKIYAVALSLDGRTLAASGWDPAPDSMGNALYLLDLATDSVRRVGAFENVVKHIVFSPDGTRVAVGLGVDAGVRVLDRDTGRELMADRDYGGDVYSLAFGPDGELLTASWDGFLRRYGPDLKQTAKIRAAGGERPNGMAVSPDGRRAAVGYDGTPHVTIHDAKTLKVLASGDVADITDGHLASVAWTADGRIAAAGAAQELLQTEWKFFIRRFGPDGKRSGPDKPVSDDTVTDLKPCGSGLVFAAADPRIGLLDAQGVPRSLQGPVTADMREKLRDALTISADASAVRFGLGSGASHPVRFDLLAGTLADETNPATDLRAPDTSSLSVTGWHNTFAPGAGAKALELEQYERSRSLAVRPDRVGFVLGTDSDLRAFDADGRPRWRVPASSVAWGVNVSADGRIVMAAYGDGTIRWHRWSNGQELLTLFVDAKDRRWVAWTPTGYYMASPGGEDLIGWHLNRGWSQEADFFPASRFRDKFNRPDVVQAVLKTLDEGEALKQADAEAHKQPDDAKPLIERLPPVLTILSPAEGTGVAPGPVEVRYRARLPSGGTVERVEAFVDGAKVEARGLTSSADGTGSIALPMPAHDAAISLVAYAGGLASDATRVQLKGAPPPVTAAPAPDPDAMKPSLYALLVGVTHYADSTLDLLYPARDAVGLAAALKGQEGRLYRHVEVKVLTDGDATVSGVRDGLVWLRRQTTNHDLAIVFAAGHGTTDRKGRFWFATREVDPIRLYSTAISNDELEEALFSLPGKKILLLDACHAGAALDDHSRGLERVDMSAVVNDFAQAEGGMVTYAASTSRELSFERAEWGHGAFTKALIEGFGGKADLMHRGTVTTATLDAYIEDRVKELTGGQQHPVMTRPKTVPDFPIAAVQ